MAAQKPEVVVEPRNAGRRERDHWRISREFPISLISTLVVQAAVIIWFFAGQSAKLETLAVRMDVFEKKLDTISQTVTSAAVPSATMTLRLDYIEARVNELRAMANDNSRRIAALESARRDQR